MLMAKKKPKHIGDFWRDRLRALRDKHGLTQAAAAQKVGVALRTWISWENRHREPSGPALQLLRIAFPRDGL